jgi:predicted nucleic acid-binding protein
MNSVDETLMYLSVITIGEIQSGIERSRDVQKRKALEEFQAILFRRFANRILPIGLRVSQRWGLLWAEIPQGVTLPAIDSLIGATALEHNLQLVSRNTADFASIGIAAINPFS